MLVKREVDHLKWAAVIRDAFLHNAKSLDVETDPSKCALGKWLLSEEAKQAYANGDAELRKTWDSMVEKHKKLHESAIAIQNELAVSPEAARHVFEDQTLPILKQTGELLEKLEEEARHELAGMEAARRIFATRTVPALEAVQGILQKIREDARKHIMTDEVMLDAARGTRRQCRHRGRRNDHCGHISGVLHRERDHGPSARGERAIERGR